MKAVGITSGIGSLLIGARDAGFDVVGNLEWRTYYHARDEHGRNTFTANFPGAIFKEKITDLDPIEIERMMNPTLALGHPECLTSGETGVYTSMGWQHIRKIRRGDLVLTHRGRFCRVAALYQSQSKSDGSVVRVKLYMSTKTTKCRMLSITGNHPILMEDGSWQRADVIRPGDRVQILSESCSCGAPVPVHPNYNPKHCSHGCQVREQWKSFSVADRLRQIQPAHEATRKIVCEGHHQFNDPIVRRKGQLTIGRRSEGELATMDALLKERIKFEHQFSVGPYFVDIAFPDLKLAVEIDGGKWHNESNKKFKDLKKQRYLEELGWTVRRYDRGEIRICIEEVQRLIANHDELFQFDSFEVRSIEHEPIMKMTMLFNLGVEEDNSYVAKGFVVHNCGAYSQLSGANKSYKDRMKNDKSDIPLFVDLVAKIKPRYFVMDDLPRSLMAYPMSEYAAKLPGYDLFPEWVSNWGYGNVQKNRNRMFMLGALKSEGWTFVPGEEENFLTVKDVLDDLPEPRPGANVPNHDPQDMLVDCFRALNLGGYRKVNTWGMVRDYFMDKPGGHTLPYPTKDGRMVTRIGFLKGHWEKHSHVLTGQNATLHNLRSEPYTIRERARIMGFPDDFVFYGTILNEAGEWNHDANFHMVRQTGKAMPVQFARYVSRQVMAHVRGEPFETTGRRIIKANAYVDQAKQWYCANVGYSDQESACRACWMAACCVVRPRLKVSAPIVKKTPSPVKSVIVQPRVEIQTRILSFGGKG